MSRAGLWRAPTSRRRVRETNFQELLAQLTYRGAKRSNHYSSSLPLEEQIVGHVHAFVAMDESHGEIQFLKVLCIMGKKSGASRYAVSADLFKPEPPISSKEIKDLFCGRQTEFVRGLELLKANFDVAGRQSKRGDKRPWVIHGESRSGKSHLARRIFAELPSTEKRIQIVVTAGERLDAITVMRELFELLRGEFMRRMSDQRLEQDFLKKPLVDIVRQLIERIALFRNDVQSVELSTEASRRDAFDVGGELSAAPLLSKFLAKYQTETVSKSAVKLNLRPPTPGDLADVCGIMIETLLTLHRINHALILVDDIDLLEAYQSATQNARQQRSILGQALDQLHGTPGIDVVLTARSWYVHSRKDLQTLVDLGMSRPMQAAELVEIHNRRLKTKGRGTGPFLNADALLVVAGDVEGLPGVFLQHLDSAFYQFLNEEDPAPRDYDWFLEVFRQRIELFKQRCGPALELIRQAIHAGQMTIDVTKENPFFGTELHNDFVYQSYWNERNYFVSGLMRKLLTPAELGA